MEGERRRARGKVWLVGAGPGDAGLLTLRGREVLERADVVVFDRLVGAGVFAFFPEEAEWLDVGKEGGRHPVPQREIEALLVDRALAGKRVVRLKGGDPFLFGRGGEEIEALRAHDIPFEVVPGVTSAFAAPGSAGIPVTHRGAASSVHVVTAHTRSGELPPLDFDALARLGTEGTLVFLMGVGVLGELCSRLAASGMDAATPAAVVERGATARQRCVKSTLASLPELVRASCVRPPAVLVVGAVVGLADRCGWRESLPLFGVRAVVTRPKGRAGRLSRMLRDAGAEVLEFPCIAAETLPGPLPSFAGAEWIVFTSAAGVEAFFALLADEGRDVREIGTARVAAVGPATCEALRARGLRVDLVPEVCDGAHLAEALAERAGGGAALLLRAESGAPDLAEGLRRRGVPFREHALYRTRCLERELPEPDFDMAVFTSASTVRGLAGSLPEGWDRSRVRAVCIGEMTARTALEAGFTRVTTASSATLEALVEAAAKTANDGEEL